MAFVIKTGADTKASIQNGDVRKLKTVLDEEHKAVMSLLTELADPHAMRLHQGIAQALKGVISLLP